jgi:hypothetical protein
MVMPIQKSSGAAVGVGGVRELAELVEEVGVLGLVGAMGLAAVGWADQRAFVAAVFGPAGGVGAEQAGRVASSNARRMRSVRGMGAVYRAGGGEGG